MEMAMMKGFSRIVVFLGLAITLVGVLLMAGVQPGYAQDGDPLPASSAPGQAQITFAQLGQSAFDLRSPAGLVEFTFELPYRWALEAGVNTYIEVHYSLSFEGFDSIPAEESDRGILDIYFDDVLALSFAPEIGTDLVVRVPIPVQTIADVDENQHRIRFSYFTGRECLNEEVVRLSILDSSLLQVAYVLQPLVVDLASFPRPLVQNPLASESVLLIIPDTYTAENLSTVASVAAAIGLRTFADVRVDTARASDVTPEMLVGRGAVVIGQPGENTFLAGLYSRGLLPTTLLPDGSIAVPGIEGIDPANGVIQEIVSDSDPDQVFVIVTGGSPEGVRTAARSLSVASPAYGFEGNLVVIDSYLDLVASAGETAGVDSYTLSELGFRDTVFQGLGQRSTAVSFFVPPGWVIEEEASLVLNYIHSSALLPSTAGITIELNGAPVGSAPIIEGQSVDTQVQIALPIQDLLAGLNRLSIDVTMELDEECVPPDTSVSWVRIRETSEIRLPHTDSGVAIGAREYSDPLATFSTSPDMSDLLLSLPASPSADEVAGVMRMVVRIADNTRGLGYMPTVVLGDLPDLDLAQYNVLAVGRPTTSSVIAGLNDYLTQPFMPGEDALSPDFGPIVYRLPAGYSLGLVEVLASPWNTSRVVVVVTGTTAEGEQWAIDGMNGEPLYLMSGDLTFIRGQVVESLDTTSLVESSVAGAIETVVEQSPDPVDVDITAPTPTPVPALEYGPDYQLPEQYQAERTPASPLLTGLAIGLTGGGLAVAIVGYILSRRKA
jgi:hypothetical protein